MSKSRRYRQSEILLEEALEFIPLGAQTFSKSITQYPRGAAPLFTDRAEGSAAWDVDRNDTSISTMRSVRSPSAIAIRM